MPKEKEKKKRMDKSKDNMYTNKKGKPLESIKPSKTIKTM